MSLEQAQLWAGAQAKELLRRPCAQVETSDDVPFWVRTDPVLTSVL